jgi:hypothetical protein
VDLSPLELRMVAAHHARVGIRATVACRSVHGELQTVAERKWDLALLDGAAEGVGQALEKVDGRGERGLVCLSDPCGESGCATYCLTALVGAIGGFREGDPPCAGEVLPSFTVIPHVAALCEQVERVSAGGCWSIWRMDAAVLGAMGAVGHASWLGWLGQHHARIWCAPVLDVQRYRASGRT